MACVQNIPKEPIGGAAFEQFLRDGAKTQDLQVLLDYKPRVLEQIIIGYIENLTNKGKAHKTISLHVAAILHFFVTLNDVPLNKKKITRFVPPDESGHRDRAYTVDEINAVRALLLSDKTMHRMDFNMDTGRAMALVLFGVSSRPQSLPSSIQDVRTRAGLVHAIDNAIGPYFGSYKLAPYYEGQIFTIPQSLFDAMLQDLTKITEKQFTDINNTNARNGVAFSLWSGCLSAAKVIAKGTREGENTPESRAYTFSFLINPLCKIDELYKAGVETAPNFKRLRNQPIDFDGVPDCSPVLVYKDTNTDSQTNGEQQQSSESTSSTIGVGKPNPHYPSDPCDLPNDGRPKPSDGGIAGP